MPKVIDINVDLTEAKKRGRPRRSTDRTDGYEPSNVGSTPTVGANKILREKIFKLVDSGEYTASEIAQRLSDSEAQWSRVHSLVFALIAAGDLIKNKSNRIFRS